MIIAGSPLSEGSIDGISRQSSISIKQSAKKKSALDNVVVCKDVPGKHVHIGSLCGQLSELPIETIEWAKSVDIQFPAILFSGQDFSNLKASQVEMWPAKNYSITQSGKLLVRVFESKLYSEQDKHYQLTIKVGKNGCKSCMSSKTGTVEDWFIIYVEVIIDTIPEQQYKQKKNSVFKVKASEFISALSRSGSVRQNPFESASLPQTGVVKLPLAMVLDSRTGAKNSFEFGGRFVVKSFTNQKLGEVTLHAMAMMGSIVKHAEATDLTIKNRQVIHQAYLSVEINGEWNRYWAILTKESLFLLDIKHRVHTAKAEQIQLADVIKIDMVGGDAFNEVGMQNCLELVFEDDGQAFMYCDNEFETISWADAISRTIWGQPFKKMA